MKNKQQKEFGLLQERLKSLDADLKLLYES
jgi:hypothetical protein